MMRLAVLLCGLAACAGHDTYDFKLLKRDTDTLLSNAGDKRVVCYAADYMRYRRAPSTFPLADLDAKLCTHIIVGFVSVCSLFPDSNYDTSQTSANTQRAIRPDIAQYDNAKRTLTLRLTQ